MNAIEAVTVHVRTNYQSGLVFLSFALSFVGAFLALTIARRIQLQRKISITNLLSASIALGGVSVWSMHFTGMLALNIGMGTGYSLLETIVSLIAAIGATAIAIVFLAKAPLKNSRLCASGIFLGCGIVVMHYLGMSGMRFPGYIEWSWDYIAASVVIAVIAACTALWLTFRAASVSKRAIASIIIATLVCAMHYTGMAAADFVCVSIPENRWATPVGKFVTSSMNLPFIVTILAISMALIIGYEQILHEIYSKDKKR